MSAPHDGWGDLAPHDLGQAADPRATVRATTPAALATAAAIVLLGWGIGLFIGQARVGVAIGAAVTMAMPWWPAGAPTPPRTSQAAGWRLTGVAVALISGGDAVGKLLGLPVSLRIIVPGVMAVPLLGLGLRRALARHGQVHRTAFDALLVAVATTLLAWQWVWHTFVGGNAPASGAVVTLGVVTGFICALMVFSRGGQPLTAERVLLLLAACAFVAAAMLVEDAALIMRSWSAVLDGIGQVLATAAVVLGQRRPRHVATEPLEVLPVVRWTPSAVAITALLSAIWLRLWDAQPAGDIDYTMEVLLVLALAGRVAQAGHDWRSAWRTLERLARVDAVTGLRNRAWLMAALPDRLRDGDVTAAIMLDVDRFKLVNDALGHPVGDQLLAVLGERLRELAATSEVVRMGGDEFLVLVDASGRADAVALAGALRHGLSAPVQFPSHTLRPTVSVGVAFAAPGARAEDLLHDADSALYRAKEAGRDQVAVFDLDMRRSAVRQLEIESGLRAAIAGDALSWVHQPVVDAVTGQVMLLEAMLRWDDPAQGTGGQPEVLDVAVVEELLGPVTWLLDAACRALVEVDRMPGWQGLPVSIKVSTARLRHLDFHDDVQRALRAAGADPRRLVLEVAESSLLDPAGPEVAALHRLSRLGVGIAVGGFGSGWSAFGYLPDMGLDLLKLDPSFTGRLGTSQRPSLVGIIIDMAHHLGIRVVADGVVTDAQHTRLVAMGCDLLQGPAVGAAATIEDHLAALAAGPAGGPEPARPAQAAADAAGRVSDPLPLGGRG